MERRGIGRADQAACQVYPGDVKGAVRYWRVEFGRRSAGEGNLSLGWTVVSTAAGPDAAV